MNGVVYKVTNIEKNISYVAKKLLCTIDYNSELKYLKHLEEYGSKGLYPYIYASYGKPRTPQQKEFNCVFYMRIENGDSCSLFKECTLEEFKTYIAQAIISIYIFQVLTELRHADTDKCGNILYRNDPINITFILDEIGTYTIKSDRHIILGDFGSITQFTKNTVMVPGKGFQKIIDVGEILLDIQIFLQNVIKLINSENTLDLEKKQQLVTSALNLKKLKEKLDLLIDNGIDDKSPKIHIQIHP